MNEQFLKQMQDLLKEEYPAYEACLKEPALRAFRVNPQKGDAEHLFASIALDPKKSSFCANGYYTSAEKGIGFSPEYLSGAFYMQEASASSAVTVLDVQKGMHVLDMCAAPGSKTTQILEQLDETGLLVANEINPKRAKILLENVERNGSANCIVTNSDTKLFPSVFGEYFDAILCDAPCSGEGMMRKEEAAETQWSEELVTHCAALQKEILENAYHCLKPGGVLVYSTCTLNMQENEYQVLDFLDHHEDMLMEKANVSFGRPAFMDEKNISDAIRIFPMDGGEGHFIARMRKAGDAADAAGSLKELKSASLPKEFVQELKNATSTSFPYYYCYQNRIYGGKSPFYDLGKIHVLRNQMLIGEVLKNRFEFSHHFFMSPSVQYLNAYDLNDEEVKKYMHGEQINVSGNKGWYAMRYHEYVLGGAKSDGHALKNKFPKAFRSR